MRFAVGFLKARDADVGINLGRGEAGVAEHFLHGAEVGPTIEQMRGKGMTQLVRR